MLFNRSKDIRHCILFFVSRQNVKIIIKRELTTDKDAFERMLKDCSIKLKKKKKSLSSKLQVRKINKDALVSASRECFQLLIDWNKRKKKSISSKRILHRLE